MTKRVQVKIVMEDGVSLPLYKTQGSAGFDLKATKILNRYGGVYPEDIVEAQKKEGEFVIAPYSRVMVGTGTRVQLPEGKMLDIRTRSGLASTDGVMVLNSPGTIDSDYTGEIGIILYNSSSKFVKYHFGDRVAQAVLLDCQQVMWERVTELTPTERGDGGFGSTGLN